MENDKLKPSPLRRKYLVDRPMQLAYSGFIVWIVGIAMVIAWLVTYYTIWSSVLNRIPQGTQLPKIISDVNLRLFWTLVIPGIVILALVGLSQVLLLHRIAGPAYRLRKTMTDMNQGQWPENVRVRNHDFLKDIVEEFNLLINSERNRHVQLTAKLEEASGLLKQLEGKNEADNKRLAACSEILNTTLKLMESTAPNSISDENDQAA